MKSKYTEEQKRQMVSLYKHRFKFRDICNEYGFSKTTMYKWIMVDASISAGILHRKREIIL